MTRRMFACLAAAPLLLAEGEADARKDGEKWLALIDQGKYRDAWKQACDHHRAQVDAPEWESQVRRMRDAMGGLQERTFTVARPSKSLAGVPDGQFMILEFTTAFANKVKAVETLVVRKEGGKWKAAAYTVH